jgi:hypothetical protein
VLRRENTWGTPPKVQISTTRGVETVGHTHTHGDSRARGSYEVDSICVPGLIDLHVEDDPVVHPRSMMLQVYTGDHMSM